MSINSSQSINIFLEQHKDVQVLPAHAVGSITADEP